ncbi:MarR family winged helix-turn-helix transcriptional regulator [Pedobacter sp. ASV28]|uniref:MarR family winged helix-turn-helix transcriptional regulator n=1 Tax=Pedobacter sp. ASV28 TaxID=2795123 RepID=UPI0018EBBEB7|nr:MarR family transcriptional regulator [Pedobacter sp. ASV28]
MNIINSVGTLALSTRLQRLSEQLRKDGALLYKEYNIDFEPKWFPVIYTLYQRKKLNIIEIASEIGYSHPSTISLLKELEKEKIVQSKKDKKDERKRIVSLTTKGESLVSDMLPVWSIINKALEEIIDNENNLLKAINEAEEKIKRSSFFQRALILKEKAAL